MNRAELAAKLRKELDVNKDGTVSLDDVITYVDGNGKKLLAIGLGVGLAGGIPVGYVLRMITG